MSIGCLRAMPFLEGGSNGFARIKLEKRQACQAYQDIAWVELASFLYRFWVRICVTK